ncbi:MAG: LLM class F420-dependent oxidoreductase [Thermodesulfobacteriales bacterium]|nr:MAG: LLM class F420-dependent oxidoreductase [Thermodesulfobacteriales bacterium]
MVKFGICLPIRLSLEAKDNIEIAKAAENYGIDSIWVSDHVVMPEKHLGSFSEVFYDPFMLLSYIAAETSTIELGTSVIILPYRNPVVVAKMIATLDVLSEGRVIFGVGPGWMREEYDALSIPYEKRGARTNEYIRAIKELWVNDDPKYKGKFCSFSDIKFYPKPLQKPHPPVFIAGASDYAIKRAVELGDGWQPTWVSPEDVKEGISKLETVAAEKGKDLSNFTYSVRNRLHIIDADYQANNDNNSESDDPPFLLRGTVSEITKSIKDYKKLGVSHIVLDPVVESLDDIFHTMEIVSREIMPVINT